MTNTTLDPVHYADDETAGENRAHDGYTVSGWYFWTETWADRIGPYPTYEAANEACVQYAESI